jgi:hypothetical protein
MTEQRSPKPKVVRVAVFTGAVHSPGTWESAATTTEQPEPAVSSAGQPS